MKNKKITLETYLNKKTMTKTFSLTIGERAAAIRLFDEFKGGMVALGKVLEDAKVFAVSEEEFKAAGLVITPGKNEQGQEVTSYQWKEEGSEKEVSLSSEGLDYLVAKIKAKNDANEFTPADRALVALNQKLTA